MSKDPWRTRYDPELYTWERTDKAHVWLNKTTDKYHYSDEASQLDDTGYDTKSEAEIALEVYCLHL
jgi:hypothetical protein